MDQPHLPLAQILSDLERIDRSCCPTPFDLLENRFSIHEACKFDLYTASFDVFCYSADDVTGHRFLHSRVGFPATLSLIILSDIALAVSISLEESNGTSADLW